MPVWKFWAKLNRELTNGAGTAAGAIKGTMTKSIKLIDETGAVVLKTKPQLGMGFTALIQDAEGKDVGLMTKMNIDNKGLLAGSSKLYGIKVNDEPYMFMQARTRKSLTDKLVKMPETVSLRNASGTIWEIVRGKAIAWMFSASGLNEIHDIVFAEGVSDKDKQLAMVLFGFRMHNFLK